MRLSCNCNLILLQMLFVVQYGMSDSNVRGGYRVTLAVPTQRIPAFIGRAYLMETNKTTALMVPGFRVALTVEDSYGLNGDYFYSCSLQIFLGDVMVWNSGHYSSFRVTDTCVLELTLDGDLQLKASRGRIGWRTGTSGQGVERLQILRMGNLVLVDAQDNVKWQSFNFPTDVMLLGQRLDVATRLTSFPNNSSSSSFYYSFEIQENKIALFLNLGKLKYSYWEFKPSMDRNISFIELGHKGLVLFNSNSRKIAQISPNPNHNVIDDLRSPRFMFLNNQTGNLGLFYYSLNDSRFEASFRALNTTCDLPLACQPYGICTFSNSCSCIRVRNGNGCIAESIAMDGFCGNMPVEMVALGGVVSVIKDVPKRGNISRDQCMNSCLVDCNCAASMYVGGECYYYGLVIGVKQVDGVKGLGYFVKVRKGTIGSHGKSGLKKWVLVFVGVVDGLIILLVIGGIACYFIRRRRSSLMGTNDT